jgi:hypothetical protein
MRCVLSCDFIGVVSEDCICKYHKVTLVKKDGVLQRCEQCEKNAYYNRLVNEMSDVLDEYNSFVSNMDKKIDDLHFLMKMLKEKI